MSLFGIEKVSRGDLNIHEKQRRGERKSCSCLSPIKTTGQSADPASIPEIPDRLPNGVGWIHANRVHFAVGYMVTSLGCIKLNHMNHQHPILFSADNFHFDSAY